MAETSRTQAGQSALPSPEGRTAIVTGANTGIGLWTAIGLAKAGAQVVMVCRGSHPGRGCSQPHFKDEQKQTRLGHRRFCEPEGGA